LRRLENKLQIELSETLKKEELMWYQRSRAKWLTDGDRNTRYYHLKTVNRRRKNNVIMLKNEQGQWVDQVEELQGMATNFYMKLFSNNQINREWLQTAITYPTLEQEERNRLAAPVSQDEVKNAMFGMHPWMEGSRAEWIPGGVL
jgi:DNA-binding NtrC family response regulator